MMHRWLRHGFPGEARFGRRTLILLHCGSVWLVTGWVILGAPMERFSRPGIGGALQILDAPEWGAMWIVGGILAIMNAIVRRFWNGRDVLGFLGLITPPFVWLIFYAWSAVTYVSSNGEYGNARSGVGLLVWYLVSAFVLIVAGWPDPDDPDITHIPDPKPGTRHED
jgi:hypothetical protein